VGHVEEHKSIR